MAAWCIRTFGGMNRKMARKTDSRFDRLESRQLFVQMPSRSKQNWHDKSPLKKCGCQQKCPLKKCGCPQKYYVSLESPGRGCRHPGVFRSLSCFFRRAESRTYETLAFIPRAWYIVRVLKSTRHHASLFFIAFSLSFLIPAWQGFLHSPALLSKAHRNMQRAETS